jgi:hypothetical protein
MKIGTFPGTKAMNFQEETTLHRGPVLAQEPTRGGAQLDSAHVGDIHGSHPQSEHEVAMIPSLLPRVRALIVSCALAFAALSFSSLAIAEDAPGIPPLAPGMRVRIAAPDVSAGRIIGTVTAVDAESVTLDIPGSSAAVSMPRDKITHLDVSESLRSRWINAAFGAAAGALGGAVFGGNHKSSLFHSDYSTGEAATDGGVLGALVGAAIGALIPPGERWMSGGGASYRVSLAPQFQHGVGLAVAMKF